VVKPEEVEAILLVMRKCGCEYLKLENFEARVDLTPPPITLADLDEEGEDAGEKFELLRRQAEKRKKARERELQRDMMGAG
jgi:hypothetical protein